jgi:hypothetical protein
MGGRVLWHVTVSVDGRLIVLHLVPVLLGDGVRFYDAPGVGQISLEQTLVSDQDQITDLRFRVPRSAGSAPLILS